MSKPTRSSADADAAPADAPAPAAEAALPDASAAPGNAAQPAVAGGADADAAAQRYRVLSPLEHDLERYAVGAEIDLTSAQAGPLLGHTVAPAGA